MKLWLPHLSEKEEVTIAELLLVCVDPEERECTISVEGQWQVLTCESLVCVNRPDLTIEFAVLLLKLAPCLLGVR